MTTLRSCNEESNNNKRKREDLTGNQFNSEKADRGWKRYYWKKWRKGAGPGGGPRKRTVSCKNSLETEAVIGPKNFFFSYIKAKKME